MEEENGIGKQRVSFNKYLCQDRCGEMGESGVNLNRCLYQEIRCAGGNRGKRKSKSRFYVKMKDR